jgi:MATE family multidrug resistance protein
MALLQQTAAYSTTFVAQYLGAKKMNMIGSTVWQSIYISIIGGLAFLLLIPMAEVIFHFIDHDEKLQILEIEYFSSLCWSALPTAIVAAVSSFYTGLGKTKTIVAINFVGLISNVLFDYLLIFGNWGFPEMGIYGAGLATSLAALVAAIFGLAIIFRPEYERLYQIRTAWRMNLDLLKRFLKYGIPSGLQWALEGLAFSFFLIIVGKMPNGPSALAASGISVTIMMLAVLPTIGLAQAVSVEVGKHIGEGAPELAERSTWVGLHISLVYMFLIGSSFVFFPQFYLNWFNNSANQGVWQEISAMVPTLLMFLASFTLFDSLNFIFSFCLKGAGDTRFVSLVALTLPWPLMVLPTWLMKDFDDAIYYSWGAASVFIAIQGLVFAWRFKQGRWKKMSVIR